MPLKNRENNEIFVLPDFFIIHAIFLVETSVFLGFFLLLLITVESTVGHLIASTNKSHYASIKQKKITFSSCWRQN